MGQGAPTMQWTQSLSTRYLFVTWSQSLHRLAHRKRSSRTQPIQGVVPVPSDQTADRVIEPAVRLALHTLVVAPRVSCTQVHEGVAPVRHYDLQFVPTPSGPAYHSLALALQAEE